MQNNSKGKWGSFLFLQLGQSARSEIPVLEVELSSDFDNPFY